MSKVDIKTPMGIQIMNETKLLKPHVPTLKEFCEQYNPSMHMVRKEQEAYIPFWIKWLISCLVAALIYYSIA